MEDKEFHDPGDFEHRIVVTEDHDCKCGKTHEKGDTLWGGVYTPSEAPDGTDPMETVTNLHSAPVEVKND